MSVKVEDLKTGIYVAGYIKGQYVEGQLALIEDDFGGNRYYFLQNRKNGSKPSMPVIYGKLGNYTYPPLPKEIQELLRIYSCSWSFSFEKGFCSQDVKLLASANSKEELDALTDNMPLEIIESDNTFYLGNKELTHNLFRIKEHPDCCGASILYNFCNAEIPEYSNYRFLTDEHISKIRSLLLRINRSSKVVHLSHTQICAKNLMKQLGFTGIHSYTNVKTNNTITIYQLDWFEEKTESLESNKVENDLVQNNSEPVSISSNRRRFGGMGSTFTATMQAYESAIHMDTVYMERSRVERVTTKTRTKSKSIRTKRAHDKPRGVIPSFYKTAMESLRYRG